MNSVFSDYYSGNSIKKTNKFIFDEDFKKPAIKET
jgi:hypothetical protein